MTETEDQLALAHIRSNIQVLYKTIGADPGTCRSCGSTIWWVKTKNDRAAPFTANALSHFADCPNYERNKK